MEDILKPELTSDDPNEIKKLFDRCLEALDRDQAQRAKVWEEIEQLNSANDAALANLRSLIQRAA